MSRAPTETMPRATLRASLLSLGLALAVYAGLRAAVLAWSFDGVAIPNYELFMGNIAVIAREGWYGPPLHRYYDNCGGHLVTGLLAVPLFGLVGETYLALKLVPVLLGAAALCLVHAVLRRGAGSAAAAAGALAFAVGPPTLAKYSMLAKGNHFENLAFQLAMVWAFHRLHGAAPERRGRWLFVFGLCAGFAVFFYFGTLAMLALLALVHLAVRGLPGALRDLRPALPGLLLGLSPLAWIFVSADARPGSFLDAKLGAGSGRSLDTALDRLASLWTDLLPRAGCFEDLGPVPGRFAEWLYLGTFALAWLSLLPGTLAGIGRCLRARRPGHEGERERFEGLVSAPFVLFLPFFSLLFSVSSFDFDAYSPPVEIGQFRYLVPHFAFATVLFGLAVGRALSSPRRARRALGWTVAAALALSQLFTLPIAREPLAVPGVAGRYPGFDMVFENNVMMRDSRPDPVTGAPTWDMAAMRAELEEFPRGRRERALLGVGFYLAWAQTLPGARSAERPRAAGLDLEELVAPFPPEFHPDLCRGVGAFLRMPIGSRPAVRGKLERFLGPLTAAGSPLLGWAVEGLSAYADFPLARRTGELLGQSLWLGGQLPADLRPAWQRGLGRALGEYVLRGVPQDLAEVRGVLERVEAGDELWDGFGFALAAHPDVAGPAPALPPALADHVPPGRRPAALRGLGAGLRHGLGPEGAREAFAALRSVLTAEERGELELGLRWPGYPAPR